MSVEDFVHERVQELYNSIDQKELKNTRESLLMEAVNEGVITSEQLKELLADDEFVSIYAEITLLMAMRKALKEMK